MAAWLKPFLLALAAALCFHALGLHGIASQMQTSSSVLDQQSDPLFTRTIEAASAAPEIAAPQPAPAVRSTRAATNAAAIQDTKIAQPTATVAQTAQTQTAAATETATATTGATATETSSTAEITSTQAVADILFTPARPGSAPEATQTAADSPAQMTTDPQTMTPQPASKTDSLLAIGQWPGDTRVSYVVTGEFRGPLHGKGQVQWTRSGLAADRYQVRVAVDVGLVELRITSQGRVSDQGLLPEVFEEYVKAALRDARVRPLKLEEREIVLADGRRIPRPTVDPLAVQDSVSQFLDLGHRFGQGRAKLETGQVITIWLGRPGGLDQWVYDVGPQETLNLPRIGPVNVFPLKPRPLVNARGTISMTMWLAPSLQYLPAKIRIDVNPQTHVELQAELIEQR